ncbi:unnamed protein product [Didymodactylos carnosus]|uniref:Transmembrane protein n=1 Tax=Didymodactylos carnosus TaxID=1234261 RepID=A0A814FIP8_9BILA|nr:unnamed protein product [Didymodactylos carnosus]CAF0983985.1 unnamed protein product [Didymodactylos carnosus]CAF3706354.1 unnamed protein product [Didymodactylos carnosus]CAF3756283.1 unnamed protein product [Didymodactylos carnosus]
MYGIKVAANEILLVEAQNDKYAFYLQFAPYDYTPPMDCSITYPFYNEISSPYYVYTVGVGKRQTSTQLYFYFIGELTSTDSASNNGTFIGIWQHFGVNPQKFVNQSSTLLPGAQEKFQCQGNYTIYYSGTLSHQEYLVMAVDQSGLMAYGLSNGYLFLYYPFNQTFVSWLGQAIWSDSTFTTRSAVIINSTTKSLLVTGYISSNRISYTPVVYLMGLDPKLKPHVVTNWTYSSVSGSWQQQSQSGGAVTYASQYDISIDINDNVQQAIVGIQSINTVYVFAYSSTSLTIVTNTSFGQSIGFGKGVCFLQGEPQIAVLVNQYSLDYLRALTSSKINLYYSTTLNGDLVVFPNNQQSLPYTFSTQFLNIISTPSALIIIDTKGQLLILLPSQQGNYSNTGKSLTISKSTSCIPGTNKSMIGVGPCSLCPKGTKNSATSNTSVASSCTPCQNDGFCPLGSVDDSILTSQLTSLIQVYAYPRSPDSTTFDDILLMNMFSIGSSPHCIIVSPLFWTFMMITAVVLFLILMAVIKYCTKHPNRNKWISKIQRYLRQVDLVGEGELWIGGLVSFAIMVLVCFGYSFSTSYYKHYPIEDVGDANFSCDKTIRNAKFDTNLQSLGVSVSSAEETIFRLLNAQELTLNFDFLNTQFQCNEIQVQQIAGSVYSPLPDTQCTYQNSVLSISVKLLSQSITIQMTLNGVSPIGGLRFGLTGSSDTEQYSTLQALNFYQVFFVQNKTLAQNPSTLLLQLTKVLNETEPLITGDHTIFKGIWTPTYTMNLNDLFISTSQYIQQSNSTQSQITLTISETAFYIQNIQQPIAKQSEIIFHNLLFTMVVIEIFGFIFLVFKLLILPLLRFILKKFQPYTHYLITSPPLPT